MDSPSRLGTQPNEQANIDDERNHHENQIECDQHNDKGRQNPEQNGTISSDFLFVFFNFIPNLDNFVGYCTLLHSEVGCKQRKKRKGEPRRVLC